MLVELETAAEIEQHLFGVGDGVRLALGPIANTIEELYPVERKAVAGAVLARQREFATGRALARSLLVELGLEACALPRGRDRRPLWPAGIVGSIAHSRKLCAVAVAPASSLRSIGIDVEHDEPLEQALWEIVCTPRELRRLAREMPEERARAIRLLFSAKESVYKCLGALAEIEIDFQDLEIEVAGSRFAARLRGGNVFEGSVAKVGQSIVAGVPLGHRQAV